MCVRERKSVCVRKKDRHSHRERERDTLCICNNVRRQDAGRGGWRGGGGGEWGEERGKGEWKEGK